MLYQTILRWNTSQYKILVVSLKHKVWLFQSNSTEAQSVTHTPSVNPNPLARASLPIHYCPSTKLLTVFYEDQVIFMLLFDPVSHVQLEDSWLVADGAGLNFKNYHCL